MEDIYRSQFRLPYPLYEQLKASADANHRSVNAELVARLESTFTQDLGAELTAGISKQALSEPDKDEGVHVLTDGQLRAALNGALESFIERLRGQTAQPKGPLPRKKYPKQ